MYYIYISKHPGKGFPEAGNTIILETSFPRMLADNRYDNLFNFAGQNRQKYKPPDLDPNNNRVFIYIYFHGIETWEVENKKDEDENQNFIVQYCKVTRTETETAWDQKAKRFFSNTILCSLNIEK